MLHTPASVSPPRPPAVTGTPNAEESKHQPCDSCPSGWILLAALPGPGQPPQNTSASSWCPGSKRRLLYNTRIAGPKRKRLSAPKRFCLLSVSAKKERLYHKGVARGTRVQAGSRTSTSHGTGPRKARLGGSLALALAGPPVSPPYAGSRSCQRKAFTDPSRKPRSPAPTPTRPSVLAACRALGADVSHRTALDLLWISPLRANASSKPNQPGEGTVPAVTHPGTVGRKAFPCFCCPKCNGRNVPVFPISGETEPLKHS